MTGVDRGREVLGAKGLDAAILERRENFAWLTRGGSSVVPERTDTGVAALVVTLDRVYLVADNIEMQRLLDEQVGELEVEAVSFPWYESRAEVVGKLVDTNRAGSDDAFAGTTDLLDALVEARSVLDARAFDEYRSFGQVASQCIEAVLRRVEPGWSEYQIQGEVARELLQNEIEPGLIQVGVDERIRRYRHTVVTGKRLERYVGIGLCGEKFGLIANTTRFAHFGSLPDDLAERHDKVAHVESALITATVAGAALSDIWRRVQELYADAGYPDEWKLHHQGGLTGYDNREWVLTPSMQGSVRAGEAYAWNPTIQGTKSEDTFLVTESGPEVVTLTNSWPQLTTTVDGKQWARAAILER